MFIGIFRSQNTHVFESLIIIETYNLSASHSDWVPTMFQAAFYASSQLILTLKSEEWC